jgi:hypothetical protein
MSKAELLIGVARYKPVLQRYDNRHLRQPPRGMRPYPGKPSRPDARRIEVRVMLFREIVESAFKQSDDSIGGMRRYLYPTACRTAARSRFRSPLGRLLSLNHSQVNSLPVLKTNFAERLKNSVFVESFDGFCHGGPRKRVKLPKSKCSQRGAVLSNHETAALRWKS